MLACPPKGKAKANVGRRSARMLEIRNEVRMRIVYVIEQAEAGTT